MVGFDEIKAIDDKIGRGASPGFWFKGDFVGAAEDGITVELEAPPDLGEGCAVLELVLLNGCCIADVLYVAECEVFSAVENVLDRRGPFATDLAGRISCDEDSANAVVLFGLNVTFDVGLEVLEAVDAPLFLGDDNGNFRSTGSDSSSMSLGSVGPGVLREALDGSGVGMAVCFCAFFT